MPTTTSKQGTSTTITGRKGSADSGPVVTLQARCYWVRAVESPSFHKCLQGFPEYITGHASMADYTMTGQLNIVNGQIVESIKGELLYSTVSPQTDSTFTKLTVTLSKSPNSYGTLAFSGNAVTWTIPFISRPNRAACFVCIGQKLFINPGPYAYNTPAGCADETARSLSHLPDCIDNDLADSLLQWHDCC